MNSDITSTIHWHFEAKNLALQNALHLRCPLSVQQQRALRLYYSEYFSHLLSATELLLENEYPYSNRFRNLFMTNLVFDGYPDGDSNYSYLRELRNSLIHRGLDITSAAHVVAEMPWVIAPPSTTNRSENKEYQSIGYYLLDVVAKCEKVIGPTISQHLGEVGLLEVDVNQEKALADAIKFIESSSAMPAWVKEAALGSIDQINLAEISQARIDSLVKILDVNGLDEAIDQNSPLSAKSEASSL